MPTGELRIDYARGELGPDALEQEIGLFFEAVEKHDAVAFELLETAELSMEDLPSSPSEIRVEGKDPGLSGVEEAIAIYLIEKGLEVGWRYVIKPWIEQRKGSSALGHEQERVASEDSDLGPS